MSNKYSEFLYNFNQEAKQSASYLATEISDTFVDDVVQIMKRENISKSELAKRSGVSKAYISKILSGYTNFTIESIAKLAQALDCKVQPIRLSQKEQKQNPSFYALWHFKEATSNSNVIVWEESKKLAKSNTNSFKLNHAHAITRTTAHCT